MTVSWPAFGAFIGSWKLTPGEADVYAEALRNAMEAASTVSAFPSADAEPWGRPSAGPPDPARPPDSCNCFVYECCVGPTCTGALSGFDIGLKDNISLAGVPMSLGSAAVTGCVPDTDAAIVTMLLAAGARIVGKLRMDAFSFGSEGFGSGVDPQGRCDNPVARGHLTGGSSSGAAAATAAGLVDAAIGGDQGGSVRVPAAWCGVVGVKPTRGAVSHAGTVGLEPTIDSLGPITRNARQAALILQSIGKPGAPERDKDPVSAEPNGSGGGRDVAGLRLGLLKEGFGLAGGQQAIDATVQEAARRLTIRGATVQWISVPDHRIASTVGSLLQLLGAAMVFGSRGYSTAGPSASLAVIRALDAALSQRSHLLPPRAKLAMMVSTELGPKALDLYQHCTKLARRLQDQYDRALRDVDLLVLPTTPVPPPKYIPPASPDEALRRALLRPGLELVAANTSPFNLTGHPAVTIPAGRADGLPVGAMLVGRWFDDLRLLRVGERMEAKT